MATKQTKILTMATAGLLGDEYWDIVAEMSDLAIGMAQQADGEDKSGKHVIRVDHDQAVVLSTLIQIGCSETTHWAKEDQDNV